MTWKERIMLYFLYLVVNTFFLGIGAFFFSLGEGSSKYDSLLVQCYDVMDQDFTTRGILSLDLCLDKEKPQPQNLSNDSSDCDHKTPNYGGDPACSAEYKENFSFRFVDDFSGSLWSFFLKKSFMLLVVPIFLTGLAISFLRRYNSRPKVDDALSLLIFSVSALFITSFIGMIFLTSSSGLISDLYSWTMGGDVHDPSKWIREPSPYGMFNYFMGGLFIVFLLFYWFIFPVACLLRISSRQKNNEDAPNPNELRPDRVDHRVDVTMKR